MRALGRREFVAASLLLACSRSQSDSAPRVRGSTESASPSPGAATKSELRRWTFGETSVSGGDVTIVVPTGGAKPPFPILVALHGRGEAVKSSAEGALGWPRDYALVRAIDRISAPPLTSSDLEGFVDATGLAQYNDDLRAHPYEGMVIVCPHMRDIDPYSNADMRGYADFILNQVLPRVRRELPCKNGRDATGIDGVSLGGAAALRIGLLHPELFGAVGGLQPAVSEEQIGPMTELAKSAVTRAPGLQLRLLTSEGDYFRTAIRRLSSAWRDAGILHEFRQVPGPHDYVFNRGPGAIELLTWHSRILGSRDHAP